MELLAGLEVKKQFKKELAASSRNDWRKFVDRVVQEIEAADEVGNLAHMVQCVRRVTGNQQRSSFTIQRAAKEDLAVRAERWAEFGERTD